MERRKRRRAEKIVEKIIRRVDKDKKEETAGTVPAGNMSGEAGKKKAGQKD